MLYSVDFLDSLMHRAAAAELMYVLEPEKKADAIKLIEESTNNLVSGQVSCWKRV